MKIPVGILVMVLFVLPAVLPCTAHGNSDDTLEVRIDALLAAYKGTDRPGLTVAIIDKGQLVFTKGYGMANLRKGIPNSAAVSYKIASVSKQFTAASIASLIQQNRLSAKEDIRKYFPAMQDYGKPISIGNLLYHTSGLRDYMVLMWLTGKSFESEFSNDDALEIILRQTALNFVPGHRCVYSNSNYILLAEILRQVTGSSLKEFANRNLFNPLSMDHTGFDGYLTQKNNPRAISYSKSGSGYAPFKNNNHAYGDGGILTAIDDLVRWDSIFYDTGSIAQKILQPGRLDNGNILSYGMGLMTGNYRQEPIQMHPGAFLGYRAEMLRFPRKNITVICLGNSDEINPETITRGIADVYVFKDRTTLPQTSNMPAAGNIKERNEALVGRYEIAPSVFVDIKYEGNQLTGQATGQPKQLLYPEKENTYQIGSGPDKVIFAENTTSGRRQLEIVQQAGRTVAHKLELVGKDHWSDFVGTYYSEEQRATYRFYVSDGRLWFRVGRNAREPAAILAKYDRLIFTYQNLETAQMEFKRNSSGKLTGFTLGSGRVSGLIFMKQ